MKNRRKFKEFIQKGNKRLIKTYFISYIFIFMFPFLVLSSILYWSFIKNIEQQAETNNHSNLKQIQTLLDNQFRSLARLGNQISINPHLTNFMLEHPFYNQEGRNQLEQYSNNNPLIESTFVYYKASDNFYSAAGLYSYSAFERKITGIKMNHENLSQYLETKTNLLIASPVQPSKLKEFQLIYYVPLKNTSSENYGTAIFFLKNQELEKILKNGTESKQDSIFLFDKQKQMVLSSNKEIDVKEPCQYLQNNSAKKISLKGIKYALATTSVADNQLKLVSLMDYSIYTQQMSNLILTLLTILVFVLLLGIILSFYLSYRQYRPFEHLDKSFKKLSLGQYPEEEILFMEQSNFSTKAISFFEEHYTLQKELTEQHEVLRTLFLYHLLEGKTGTVQELQKKMYDFGLPFEHGNFTVCIVQPYLTMNTQKKDMSNSQVLTNLPINVPGMHIETLQLPFTNFWICILFLPNQEDTCLSEKYQFFEKQINQLYNADYRFFYGRSYPNALHISQSYKEACASQEYGLFHPENKTVWYNDISQNNENFSLAFQHQKLAKLRQSLDDGNSDEALQAIDSLFDDERLKKVSVNVFKCYYYDMINLILKIALNMDIKLPEDNVKHIINTHSLIDAKEQINEIVALICIETNERKRSKQSEQDNQIIQYIQENFASLDFSLETTAKMFGLTSPYLSRLIKKEIGLTASKYVQHLRLEKIKKELIETDEPIKTIIVNAGYYDISNYSRKFKQLVGVTPGQYRTLNKQQEGNDPHEDFSK